MTQIPEPVQRDYPAPKCGQLVGKGLVNYPCDQPQDHDGPHSSIDNPASVNARIAWETAMVAETARQPNAIFADADTAVGDSLSAPPSPVIQTPVEAPTEPSGIFPGVAPQTPSAPAYPAGPEPSPAEYAEPQIATQPTSHLPAPPPSGPVVPVASTDAQPVPAAVEAFAPAVVRFGDDLRLLLDGLYAKTYGFAVNRSGTATDAAWMLQAVETLRDVFDKDWREQATKPSG